ncbi:hypothetical protein [Thetidibacter halocola]|uniref:Alpha/beta hydrolase n=1 Tax=Thetidibacter halocola TaxID=2827239 RepID=A0A8J7WJU4_9RHOB|nr:hypothetical protein [Thetidibacter halocola]MBS0126566.1 hypothetical protein [Thetidibacter halocola]
MPILRISTGETGPRLHGVSAPLLPALRHALSADPGPVTVMIHGFKYQPGHPRHCPHESLLSRRPAITSPRIVSWPRRLGLRGQPGEGLGLSFGWTARGSIWHAWRAADAAGAQLAVLLGQLARLAPGRPVHLVAHSLGVRVALAALARSAPGAATRAILMTGAEYRATADHALRSPGGAACTVLNVTSRENDLFDFLLERLVSPPVAGDRVLGHAPLDLPHVATLQLDDPQSLAALRGAGFAIGAPQQRVCHWSPYLRPGAFPLYRAFLSGRLEMARLRAILPGETAPRWSRLRPALPGLPLPRPLPLR